MDLREKRVISGAEKSQRRHPLESAEGQLCPPSSSSGDMSLSETTWEKSSVSSPGMDGVGNRVENSQTNP